MAKRDISVKEYGCTDLPMDHGTTRACKAYYHGELLSGIANSEFLKTLVLNYVAYNSAGNLVKWQLQAAGKNVLEKMTPLKITQCEHHFQTKQHCH
jgi:hypothetical protein